MIFVIGEVLIDHFPQYSRIGGAPFNFAYHLKRMGFPVRFLTRVGDDAMGSRIIGKIKESGFDSEDIQIDGRYPTGSVRVTLDEDGVPQFNILEDVAYDHLTVEERQIEAVADASMIYFGTLVQRTTGGYEQVQKLLAHRSVQTVRFLDINLRPPHVNPDAVEASLGHADLLKLNEDELSAIQRSLNGPSERRGLIDWLMEAFDIGTLALTRGSNGSRFYHGGEIFDMQTPPPTTIVDTVGAGDAFAAVLAAGMLRGIAPFDSVRQASLFAACICGIAGAVPDDASLYDDLQSMLEGSSHGH